MRLASWLSGVMVIALAIAAFYWLQQYEQFTAVDITAAHDVPDNALPVYAQFSITQTLHFDAVHDTVAVVIPVFFPADSQWLQIDLRRNGTMVQRWRVQPPAPNEIVELSLPFQPPLLLDGELEVVFIGQHIDHEHQARAPRIFVETAGAYYPHGTYYVAANEKNGDIAMSFLARRQRWQTAWLQLQNDPVRNLARGAGLLLVPMLAAAAIRSVFMIFAGKAGATVAPTRAAPAPKRSPSAPV